MYGDLADLPLLGIFDLIHAAQQSGTLHVQYNVPYHVLFSGGELVGGGILDWQGIEALNACSLLTNDGTFRFVQGSISGASLGPYDHLMTEWARVGDEWRLICPKIGSPSRFFVGQLAGFEEPISIRAVAKQTGRSLITVAQDVAEALTQGKVQPVEQFEWFRLQVPSEFEAMFVDDPLALFLSSDSTLGEFVATTQDITTIRQRLVELIESGDRFKGCGWVLRDLVWELSHLS